MAVLTETVAWPTPIYSIERTDPVMGGELGVNNVQATQLASRTQYLRALLGVAHAPDGSHSLTEAALAAAPAIAESKLALPLRTAETHAAIEALRARLARMDHALDTAQGAMGTPLKAIYDALMLSWEYGHTRFAFELFSPAFTLRDVFTDIPITETIAGDDSMDVASTATMSVGETYLLLDRTTGVCETVTVKDILTEQRVVLHETLQNARNHQGVVTKCAWKVAQGRAEAASGTWYLTGMTSLLKGVSRGSLIISQSTAAPFRVEYRREGDELVRWAEASLEAQESVGSSLRSRYTIPGGVLSFRLSPQADAVVEHITVMSDTVGILPSTVRTPTVLHDALRLERFGALYDAKHTGTHVQLSPSPEFTEASVTVVLPASTESAPVWDLKSAVLQKKPMSDGETLYWRARYLASDGQTSLWSATGRYTHGGTP